MATTLRWLNEDDWTISELKTESRTTARSKQRRGETTSKDVLQDLLDDPRLSVVNEFMASPSADGIRRGGEPELAFELDTPANTSTVLAIRHPSGALSFHAPETLSSVRRSGKSLAKTRFRVTLRGSSVEGARRGIITRAIRAVVLKVTGKVADLALPLLVRAWENRAWNRAKRVEAWHRVTQQSLVSGRLDPEQPEPGKRSLLLLHGTFSHAASAFGSLAQSDFFDRIKSTYDSRIYAFNHFSLSRTPGDNAQMLLDGLDRAEVYEFDVVTHSRGGLVLRTLIERPEILTGSERIRIQRAVLVASPNEGTPLATADRWQQLLNWISNLLEVFPTNPWSEAASWVADSLVWIAHRVSGGIPGIGAMDTGSNTVSALQSDPSPPQGAYSALVANYRAEDGLLQRAIDVGADAVFATANDLVVGSEGGWRTGRNLIDYVPSERVGCFGIGGNLLLSSPGAVNHVNFFDRPETIEFLARALTDRPHELPLVPTDRNLPQRRSGLIGSGTSTRLPDLVNLSDLSNLARPARDQLPLAELDNCRSTAMTDRELDVFRSQTPPLHLVLLPEHETETQRHTRRGSQSKSEETPIENQASAQMLASFGSARVLEPFYLRGGLPGSRWLEIIEMQNRLKSYVNGEMGCTLPEDPELVAFGTALFETLLPGRVRRLYDEARARSQGRRLDIIFTSMISWVADKPWEFAYDPLRKSFLATEDVQFVRNVLTAVPAQDLKVRSGALRILVVAAQPIGQAKLSVEGEIAVIRRGFESLVNAGMASVTVLPRATASTLHARLSTESFDVVHFIGHGEFDTDNEHGYLLFEDDTGSVQRVSESNLRSIFCQRGVRLLFLNACETGSGGKADFNRGVAPAIVAGGMPVVVANQFKVLDVSATSFAQHFYWSLAAGLPIGDAARESRIAVNYSYSGESIDWAVPVVFARDPNARLCARRPSAEVVLTTIAPTKARRGDGTPQHLVGVWDVQHDYPQMETLVNGWNEAQDSYRFEVVDPSVPVGGWQMDDDGISERMYLRSDVLGPKLRSTAKQLGVDTLACICTSPMSDGEILNLYADDSYAPVVMISTSDFVIEENLIPKLLTNLVTGSLIARRGKLESSKDLPKTSPMYHNAELDSKLVTATLKLDTVSIKQIRKTLGKSASKEIQSVHRLFSLYDDETTNRSASTS